MRLILASVLFYAAWSVPFVGLIALSAVVDYTAGRVMGRAETSDRTRRRVLAISLVMNLGLLGYFKYSGFFLENVHAVLGIGDEWSALDVILPPGISFYTFQTMSYTIDVYRRKIEPTRSFLRFFLYVSFFPQLIAGPIERAGHLLVQFDHAATRPFRVENLVTGGQMILWGMFKKVVISDHCARVVNAVYAAPDVFDGWSALVATYAFTLQIYCDFSAYSEIARGSARIFGIDLMQNFDQPYLTTSIRDFWRRWHISLSNWFRDYVYVPLGGSRKGRARALINLTATMFLSGLWHGAAWTFVLWGLFHGLLLVVNTFLTRAWDAWRERAPGGSQQLVQGLSWFVTFHLVALGWILFRADGLEVFRAVVVSIAGLFVAPIFPSPAQLGFVAFLFLFVALSAADRRWQLRARLEQSPSLAAPFGAALLVSILLLAPSEGAQFIYFQF